MSTDQETPLCWLAFLEDMESTTILLSYATHPPPLEDTSTFLRPVPLMLASTWEAFHTRCVSEAAGFLSGFCTVGTALPKELRKQMAAEVKREKDELSPWSLADDKWRAFVRKRVDADALRLRSGKSAHIEEYYSTGLGLVKLSSKWSGSRKATASNASVMDAFITARDRITHRGESHLSVKDCWKFRQLLILQVIRTISVVNKHIASHTKEVFCGSSMVQLRRQLNPYEA